MLKCNFDCTTINSPCKFNSTCFAHYSKITNSIFNHFPKPREHNVFPSMTIFIAIVLYRICETCSKRIIPSNETFSLGISRYMLRKNGIDFRVGTIDVRFSQMLCGRLVYYLIEINYGEEIFCGSSFINEFP